MKKYLQIFKANLAVSLEYRGNLLVWTMVEIVSLASVLFIWTAIFRDNPIVGNYNYQKIIGYYFIIPIVSGFTSIYLSEHLPRKIKDGEISSDLMKPFHIGFASLINQFSIKLTQLTIKLPIYLAIGLIINKTFGISYSFTNLLAAFFFCVFGYILHYSVDLLISYSAFWIDDIWALSLLKYVVLMIFGGLTFPLDLLPPNIAWIFNMLPFKFIYYIPSQIALGRIGITEMPIEFLTLFTWIILLLTASNFIWKSGIKKYGAYGN